MLHMNRTAITYFTGTFLMSAAFCLALLNTLAWPLSAEIPLGISIFIQLTAVAKALYGYIAANRVEITMLGEVFKNQDQGR